MLVFLLFIVVQAVNAAVVPMNRHQDPLLIAIDDVAGLLYEVPEYEDPELIEHQLEQSLGGMPVFTLLEVAQKQGNFKVTVPQKEKLQETKKAVDDIINKLQEMKSKLEKGFENVYPDIQKSIQNLKHLERSYRPDIRQLLQAAMAIAKPLMTPDIIELVTTKRPVTVTVESQAITPVPEAYDRKELSVRVISSFKSAADESPESVKPIETSVTSYESSKENDDRSNLEKSSESVEDGKLTQPKYEEVSSGLASNEQVKSAYIPSSYSKYQEDYPPKKNQYETDKKRSKKYEDTQEMTLFQPKWTWKSEQLL